METKKLYYKSDFTITEKSESGYGLPFKFKYYTGSPKKYHIACFDGTTYHGCSLDDNGNLVIAFDDQHMGVGTLMVERHYYLNNEQYASGICDLYVEPKEVVIEEDGKQYYLVLGFEGNITIDATSVVEPYWAKGDTGKSAYESAVEQGFEGTEAEWLASLKGDTGAKVIKVIRETKVMKE